MPNQERAKRNKPEPEPDDLVSDIWSLSDITKWQAYELLNLLTRTAITATVVTCIMAVFYIVHFVEQATIGQFSGEWAPKIGELTGLVALSGFAIITVLDVVDVVYSIVRIRLTQMKMERSPRFRGRRA